MHSVQIYELKISTENIILTGKRLPGCSWTTWSRVGGNTDNGRHAIMCWKLYHEILYIIMSHLRRHFNDSSILVWLNIS